MARIRQAELERLQSEVSVERLVEAAGVELKRAGADRLGRCPFHDDAEPSLVVTPAKNRWRCAGCKLGGGPVEWVMKTQGVSLRHAVELLRAGEPLAGARPVKHSTVRALAAPVALDADDQELLRQVVDYYHATLKTSPEALAYLESRGIRSAEAIEHFRLGFANRTLGLRLPAKTRKAGAAIRARLARLGVLRASGHEHFNGCLVIPVIGETGAVTGLYGRKITAGLRAGTPLDLYLSGPPRSLWNSTALAASREVILCEGLIDALTFWCAGFRHVTAAYGGDGFTADHLAAFKRFGTERVLVAYDRDEAGDRAADALAARLSAGGIECWRVRFPPGLDANAYALKFGPAEKSLGLLLRKALWMGRGAKSERVGHTEASTAKPTTEAHAPFSASQDEAPAVASASPVPPAPPREPVEEVKDAEVVFTLADRRYRVRGLARNLSIGVLKVNLLVSRSGAAGEAFHVDTLDLYSAKQRASYLAQAALELGLPEESLKHDLGRVLLALERLQDESIRKALEPKPAAAVPMTESEREAALALLRSPDLAGRILEDFAACGIVGERTNALVGYLAATSRKLEHPLAVVIQSASAAGKTSLMDAILAFMPEEARVKYSAMTGQSLFYMGSRDLKHKILAIVEEEGAAQAAYALKILQSEGELTIASTGKDAQTGNLVTREYRVEGPVMIFLTTTSASIDEELQNRCLVLAIDEGRSQTQAIHALQRERRTLEGLLARAERDERLAVHRNAQHLLRPLAVLNPYARELTFPDEATRTRRDHEKYLTLIDTIALLHQYQREVKVTARRGRAGESKDASPPSRVIEYVEVTLADIALANELAHEVLGRSLDELPPQTRRLLHVLDEFVAARASAQAIERAQVRFSRRELREATGIGDTQLRLHLGRLVALEYLLAHRQGAGGRFVYELLYDGAGRDGRPFVPGLIDSARLAATTANARGPEPQVAGRLRADRGPLADRSRGGASPEDRAPTGRPDESAVDRLKTHIYADDVRRRRTRLAP
jgi:DNA primase catalytic core